MLRRISNLVERVTSDRPEKALFDAPMSNAELEAKAENDLERLVYGHSGRLLHKWHHYLVIYDGLLASRRGSSIRLLEIGVSRGGSLELWRDYLGAKAAILGIDIDPACAALDRPDLPVRIGSQDDLEFLASVVAEMGGSVDVVIDDGSHIGRHQIASFRALWPHLTDGGLYIVEDCHTSYWRKWEGGHKRLGTFLEFTKSLIDDLHGWHHRAPGVFPAAKTEIASIAVHDSMVIISKAKRQRPFTVKVGG